MMTRKHFQLLADMLAETKPDTKPGSATMQQWRKDCQTVAMACRIDNYRFQCGRFFAACGYDDK